MKSIFIIKKYKYMILSYEDNEIIELFRKIFVLYSKNRTAIKI